MNKYNYQEAEQHYNVLVYSVLGAGIALSLFIIQIQQEDINYYFLSYGYLALFVSTLLIESFSQKILFFRNKALKLKIKKETNYISCRWFVESLILTPIFIYYISLFQQNIFLFIISIILYVIVLINWMMRPRDKK